MPYTFSLRPGDNRFQLAVVIVIEGTLFANAGRAPRASSISETCSAATGMLRQQQHRYLPCLHFDFPPKRYLCLLHSSAATTRRRGTFRMSSVVNWLHLWNFRTQIGQKISGAVIPIGCVKAREDRTNIQFIAAIKNSNQNFYGWKKYHAASSTGMRVPAQRPINCMLLE